MPILLFFTLFALLDFVILFAVGSEIGLLTTLALVLATGFIGLHLVRREGVATLTRAQHRFANGELPSDELLTGAALIFGGALLMAPGFLSDTLGFMCLIPTSRRLLGKWLTRANIRVKGFAFRTNMNTDDNHRADFGSTQWGAKPSDRDEPLEGEFIDHDERR
ncbi:FxsA family protein [Aidingimonas lacisalsi]|uniref:FxsA family protein n=1 Tax=Aidingimonas lacisalsi TaxID=2604086 RepID=UPI0011D1B535|nr:FxsA family protein [Aidingimonas lacisalsi]